ncbi:hypothetical protein KC332_g6543 [Hortaea werneckii]|nr:hypothetical protein KC358_g4641 [Hortaea werneckii]KAI6850499.1 hypothetical protein KC350_g2113 [Hortaea werneckii]KAI6943359.1 hypothetical protein KC341_g1571 [Hortaea werneckii]KAI6949281.1 hypothetical protein KC348_g1441 [Hortaea werneckii]KAI6981113.1 hypothetical protein KC321_g1395 [Hortaea werneckii]
MSDQYNSTADGLSGGDGAPSNDTITAGQYDELNELLRQVEEQEQKLRELKAEERIANKRLAILGVVAKKAAESPLDEEDKARAEGK